MKMAVTASIAACAIGAFAHAGIGVDVRISEIRIEQPGPDLDEYVELVGAPGTDLSGLTYVVIGDLDGAFPPNQNGHIEEAVSLKGLTIPASGRFTIAEATISLGTPDLVVDLNFEGNDNVTHLLVADFTGAVGDDLDTDNDGILDVMPWSASLDDVALVRNLNPDGFTDDFYYSDITVGPDGGLVPGHAWTCDDTFAWRIGGFTVGTDDTFGMANGDCGSGGGDFIINEIRIDQPGSDNDEYFELVGEPGQFVDGLTYVVLGDDGAGNSGVIENATLLTGSVPASGFFVVAEATFTLGVANQVATLNFENSDNVTHILVEGFTGKVGDILDADADGELDTMPWTAVLDDIAILEDPIGGDLVYSDNTVGPDGSFVPAHSYRCSPDGTWTIGNFDPADGTDTANVENLACPAAGGCGGTDPVSCFETNEVGGCADSSCCDLVCAVDASCCDVAWDAGCVAIAEDLCLSDGAAPEVMLSELRFKQPGDDDDEYFEITGAPGTSLDGATILVLGDGETEAGFQPDGVVELAINLGSGTIPASGRFVVATPTFTLGVADLVRDFAIEDGGTKTFLLVFNFTGTVNADLDVDGDCVLDSMPWDSMLDGVASIGDDGECAYSDNIVGPDGAFSPAHAYRCDPSGEWRTGTFDPTDEFTRDTPGDTNAACSLDKGGCGDPGAGDCDDPNGIPGCSDLICCETVCNVDPTCCEIGWDADCVEIADMLCSVAPEVPALDLAEIRVDQPGDDNDEYVEIYGEAGANLNGTTLIVIGDGAAAAGSGVVESVVRFAGNVVPEDGILVVGKSTLTLGDADIVDDGLTFENNDNLTVLLVFNDTVQVGDDLDADDDGVLDMPVPWAAEIDSIALIADLKGSELVYSDVQIGPSDDGFVPPHAFFDCTADMWMIGAFDPIEGTDTVGVFNTGCDGVTPCPGDLDGNGEINGADLTILLGAWGTDDPVADIDGDGSVGGADLTILLGGFGPCP